MRPLPWAGRAALVVVVWLSALGSVAAQQAPAAARTNERTEGAERAERTERPALSAEVIKPGLYRLTATGGGAGSVLRVAGSGLVLVDSQRAGSYPALMAQVRRLAAHPNQPLRALVLTAAGPDQAGSAAPFLDAGVPVIVQERALAKLPALAQAAAGSAANRRLISFSTDYVLHGDEHQIDIEHVGSGRTGADAVVLFRDLRVLVVGDLYTADTPVPDCASGGSYAGWASALLHVLELHFDLAVPSRGVPVGKPELRALKLKLDGLAARGAAPGAPSCPAAG